MKKVSVFLVVVVMFSFEAFAQRKVSGTVFSSDGYSLPGVNIHETGTDNSTSSDIDGAFHIITTTDECNLSFLFIGFVEKTIYITQDTIINIVLEEDCTGCCDCPQRLAIGANFETLNSMIGLSISNGYDEKPLIHFEDFADRVIYKFNAQTNFSKDYSFGANIGWLYPFEQLFKRFPMISAGYSQYDYPSKDFSHRDIHVSVARYFISTGFSLITGYQSLNGYKNWGASMRLQRHVMNYKLLVGASAGYYFDYMTCSAYMQGIVHKNVSFRLDYERIDTYDFFKIGMNLILHVQK